MYFTFPYWVWSASGQQADTEAKPSRSALYTVDGEPGSSTGWCTSFALTRFDSFDDLRVEKSLNWKIDRNLDLQTFSKFQYHFDGVKCQRGRVTHSARLTPHQQSIRLLDENICPSFRLRGRQCHYHCGKYISEVGMSGSLAKVEDMGVGGQTENRWYLNNIMIFLWEIATSDDQNCLRLNCVKRVLTLGSLFSVFWVNSHKMPIQYVYSYRVFLTPPSQSTKTKI